MTLMMTRFLSDSNDFYPEGQCAGSTIYQTDHRESEVLDQYGRPFLIGRPFKLGFDLNLGSTK